MHLILQLKFCYCLICQFLHFMFNLVQNICYMQIAKEVNYHFKAFGYAIKVWKYAN